jgi:hypothetical protein
MGLAEGGYSRGPEVQLRKNQVLTLRDSSCQVRVTSTSLGHIAFTEDEGVNLNQITIDYYKLAWEKPRNLSKEGSI